MKLIDVDSKATLRLPTEM